MSKKKKKKKFKTTACHTKISMHTDYSYELKAYRASVSGYTMDKEEDTNITERSLRIGDFSFEKQQTIRDIISRVIVSKLINTKRTNIYEVWKYIVDDLIGRDILIDEYTLRSNDAMHVSHNDTLIEKLFTKWCISIETIKSISIGRYGLEAILGAYEKYLEDLKSDKQLEDTDSLISKRKDPMNTARCIMSGYGCPEESAYPSNRLYDLIFSNIAVIPITHKDYYNKEA